MLHTKFQGHRSAFWFRRRRFLKVFTIYWHGAHLGQVTWTVWTYFRSPVPRRLHMKFGFNWPSDFRGDVWKYWQHTHAVTPTPTHIRRTQAYLYYKLTIEPKGSGELKILTLIIWPKSEVSGLWNIGQEVMALVYTAGLTEIYPHMKYQLATINRSWDSTLAKNLNLDNLAKVWSQWTMKYRSGGHGSCISSWSHRDTSSYEISTCYH